MSSHTKAVTAAHARGRRLLGAPTSRDLTVWLCLLAATPAFAQDSAPATATPSSAPTWSWSAAAALYMVPDDANYGQPTIAADRGRLHLEARYNYEAQKTLSAWVGVNFEVGDTVSLAFTPMFGVITGDLDGVAPGFLLTLSGWKLELYSEGEHVYDAGDQTGNFFYNWTEFTIQATERLRAGLVTQRTRAYQTERDIQRGLLVGLDVWKGSLTTSVFEPFSGSPTVVVSFGVEF